MAKTAFDRLLARLAATEVVTAEMMQGCTPAEVQELERRYAVTLPASYRRFLEVMGHKSGRLFTHDWVWADYSHVLNATAEVRAGLADSDEPFRLPADAVVVLTRDVQFQYLRCTSPLDSPVWTYHPGFGTDNRPWLSGRTVVSWLRVWADEAAEAVASGWYANR